MKLIKSIFFWISIQPWLIRPQSGFLRLRFLFQKAIYQLNEKATEITFDFQIFFILVKSVLTAVVLSVLTIILINFFSPYVGYVKTNNVDSYDNLLIAVASITGIFLSLYFTGLNTVVGNLYAKSPHPVRNLFVQERIGSFSVKFIIWLTLVSFGSLLIGVTWDIRSKLTILVVVISGCFCILFFAQLGKRAFYFFDPTGFSKQLLFELDRWSKQSSSSGLFFSQPEFQAYYHKKGVFVLEGFKGLNQVALSENHLKDEALLFLIKSVINTYCNYLHVKRQIPVRSKWFEYVNRYKDWYLSSESYLFIAASAKAELFPSNEPNHHWLEDGLESIETTALTAVLKDNKPNTMGGILSYLSLQFIELGKVGDITQALQFLSKIEVLLTSRLEETLPAISELQLEQNDTLEILGILDALCSYWISLVASFFSSFDILDPSLVTKTIERQHWTRKETPYNLDLPFEILPAIEDISEKLIFENQVEGKIISPNWYISELIVRKINFYIIEKMTSLITQGINYFTKWVEINQQNSQIIKAVVVIDRGLEFSEKLKTMVYKGSNLIEKMYKLKFIDLEWGDWKQDVKLNDIDRFSKGLIARLASYLPELSKLKRSPNLPDYFGKSLVLIENECYQSLSSNDLDYFRAIFSKLFSGCLLTYENLRILTDDWEVRNRLLTLSEPLQDLFELSGYSLLYSEFHQNQGLWEICKTVWNNFLENENLKSMFDIMGALYTFRKEVLSITIRDTLRSNWEQYFLRKLKSLPMKVIDTGSLIGGIQVIDHPSEIITAVAGINAPLFLSHHPDEVFIDLYLKNHSAVRDVKFKIRNPITETLSIRRKQKLKI